MPIRGEFQKRQHTATAVGQTDFTQPAPPQIVDYELYQGDPKCKKVIWQPGGKENALYIISTQPIGPDKALGYKMTPTLPEEQKMFDETRGEADSLVNTQPMSPAETAQVMARLSKVANPALEGLLKEIPLK